jgi:hypothetical protein
MRISKQFLFEKRNPKTFLNLERGHSPTRHACEGGHPRLSHFLTFVMPPKAGIHGFLSKKYIFPRAIIKVIWNKQCFL